METPNYNGMRFCDECNNIMFPIRGTSNQSLVFECSLHGEK